VPERYNQTGSQEMDQIAAADALMGVKIGATACLKGFLESATPECKDFFWKSLKDYANEHDEITQIMMKKGWYKPYQEPHQMVTQDVQKAISVIGQTNQAFGSSQGADWQGQWQGNQQGSQYSSQWQTGNQYSK